MTEEYFKNLISKFEKSLSYTNRKLRGKIELNYLYAAKNHKKIKLDEGKIGCYVFIYRNKALKIGKAGLGSKDRFRYQHYLIKGAGSTLAKSLYGERKKLKINSSKKMISNWILKNTNRANFILDEFNDGYLLNFFEAFLIVSLKPRYESKYGRKK